MNIVIVGAGKLGSTLVKNLVEENHDITVIDSKPNIVDDIVNTYDVMGFCGNGASLQTLTSADAENAQLLVACTPSDEVNILCCLAAKSLGIVNTIARIRNPEYSKQVETMKEILGINLTVNPDLYTANEIFRILRFPSATHVEAFANGRVYIVQIKVEKDSTICNKSLMELRDQYQVRVLIAAVKRNDEVFIPHGDFVILEGDEIYITADTNEIDDTFRKLGLFKEKMKSAMVVGGSRVTHYLTKMLNDMHIVTKIIDSDIEVCDSLSHSFPKNLILHGDASNQKLLVSEGLTNMDAFVSLTGIDETNIISSTFAKSVGVKKVITKVNNQNYDSILNSVGLDSNISPKDIFSNAILRYVRGMESSPENEFKTLYRLVGNRVEALEFGISFKTSYTSIPLKDLKLKHNVLLASIIRNNEVIIPGGMTTLEPGDSVIIISCDEVIKDLEDILR